MHDPKFEKEVQRKMQELEFVPSDEVWANIQQGIAPRERRRAVALFWWWLVPGALLLGSGLLMYRHPVSTPVAANAPLPVANGSGGAGNGSGSAGNVAGSAGNVAAGVSANGGAAGSAAGGRGNVRTNDAGISGASAAAGGTGTTGKLTGITEKFKIGGRVRTGRRDEGSRGALENATAGTAGSPAVTTARAPFAPYRPGLIGGLAVRRGVTAPRLFVQPANTAVSGLGKPRHPWVAGFAAGGGLSSIRQDGGSGSANGGSYGFGPQLPASAQVRSSFGYNASKEQISKMQSSLSYWAGVYGEKRLSARWSVDIGLNLHYYSVELTTNQQLSTYAPTSSSLLAPSVVTYTLTSPGSYGAVSQQTYLNRYYFLEIPAAVQWKINRSRSVPVYWRGGALLSYRMASNALYYNERSGEYEKDNAVTRHMQLGLQSGIMVGLPVKGIQLQVGPEVQYALTSMLTTASGGGQLFYGGLRVALTR